MKSPSRLQAWGQFTAERFPPAAHGPMVLAFVLGNFALAAKLGGAHVEPVAFGLALLISASYFYRLRCFDEIKDYAVDCAVNPTRPLARGLLSIGEVKGAIGFLTALEIAVAAWISWRVLCIHLIAVLYSFLMYNEFFIGRRLRPHLTTYALLHTISSAFLAWSIAAQATLLTPAAMPWPVLVAGFINWFLFNLFEFARKTFARSEERPHVESYSSLFGVPLALLLSLSQVAVALALLAYLALLAAAAGTPLPQASLLAHGAAASLPAVAAGGFLLRRGAAAAGLFRATVSAYLLLFYVLLAWQGLA